MNKYIDPKTGKTDWRTMLEDAQRLQKELSDEKTPRDNDFNIAVGTLLPDVSDLNYVIQRAKSELAKERQL